MTPPGRPVKEDDLHARIDGQLPQERTADVEIYLAAHPEVEARFSQYAARRQELRAAFFSQANGAIPNRLRVAYLVAQKRRRRYRQLAQIAAAVGQIIVRPRIKRVAEWSLPAWRWRCVERPRTDRC